VLTFVTPEQTPAQDVASGGTYSAESVIFDEADAEGGQMSYGQVLTTLYESDEDGAR
jgi:hypothetical protein